MFSNSISIADNHSKKEELNKEVKKITLEKVSEIDKKLNELKNLRDELNYLANNCNGDNRPNCPILEAFSKK